MEKIQAWDSDLFLYLNSNHSDIFDPFMYLATQTWPWIPLYLFLAILLIRNYKKFGWWLILAAIAAVSLADKFTSGFMKPYFGRLRPCHEPELEGMVYNYLHCGGLYGFASSHAATSFAVTTFMVLLLSKKYPGILFLWIWALFFTYTRIYLGVHYPADVIVGAMVGASSAGLVFYLTKTIALKTNQRYQL